MAAREFDIILDGTKIRTITFGDGPRDMVMIAGLNIRDAKGSGAGLALSYRAFAKQFRVWLFDRPEPLPEDVSIEYLADMTARAMEAQGIEKADVFGVSQGGMIAQALAVRHPEKVTKLVLGVTACRASETTKAVIGRWSDWAKNDEFQKIAMDLLQVMYSPKFAAKYKRVFPFILKFSKLMDKDRFVQLAGTIQGFDLSGEIGKIECPVLVLGGMEDRIVTPEASFEIAELTGGEIYMYPDLGHSAYEEARDFNARVLAFLTR